MPTTIAIPNGFITLSEVDFECPNCSFKYEEKDYYKSLSNSKRGYIYKTCKGCNSKIGVTVDYRSDVVVWLKDEEQKQPSALLNAK